MYLPEYNTKLAVRFELEILSFWHERLSVSSCKRYVEILNIEGL